MLSKKRIHLFAGHYGSGKTNIAVNFALRLKKEQEKVVIADLDIVNPYFRTRDSLSLLEENGIRLISSEFASSNVDLPALPQATYGILDDRTEYAVMDIGGDDRGAYALGRYTDGILSENNYEMYFVVNCFRPLTATPEEALGVLREIEGACRLPFTAIVNNSNLGTETTPEDVLSSAAYAERVSLLSGLPVAFTSVEQTLYNQLGGKIENLFPLTLQSKII